MTTYQGKRRVDPEEDRVARDKDFFRREETRKHRGGTGNMVKKI